MHLWWVFALAVAVVLVMLIVALPFVAARERKIDAQRQTGRYDDDAS